MTPRQEAWADAGICSVRLFGDSEAAGLIAWGTYAGHRYAWELDGDARGDALSFRREITELAAEWQAGHGRGRSDLAGLRGEARCRNRRRRNRSAPR